MSNKSAPKEKMDGVKGLLPMVITVFVLVIMAIAILAAKDSNPVTYTMYNSKTISYEKASVTAVLTESVAPAEGMPGWSLGSQDITVRFTNGPLRGQEVTLNNTLSTTHNIYVRPGQAVIVKADRPEGVSPYYTLYNYDRAPGLLAVFAIFFVFMLIVGRLKGFRSVLGLGISLFFIFALLLPAIYRGRPPVLMSIAAVLLIAVFSILLLNGFSQKSYTALLAVVMGVLLSALFFSVISAMLHLVGYNIEEAEELILVSRETGLKIGEVLFAGVLVSSIGAVIDMSVSVAASMHEIYEKQPGIPANELFRSGMAIGRDMIGAQCMTLIMAFVGSSLATLLSLIAYGARLDQVLSSDYVAVEVAHGITGSLAVIVAVPLTAGLCLLLNRRRTRKRALLPKNNAKRA
ncbi:MAG: YibE/F family protein [Clostridiales Family XIII bacterium]|nr:YibE/F family protein [Clostridiales Family XIII bacterium]